jgi:hypothetical protein
LARRPLAAGPSAFQEESRKSIKINEGSITPLLSAMPSISSVFYEVRVSHLL